MHTLSNIEFADDLSDIYKKGNFMENEKGVKVALNKKGISLLTRAKTHPQEYSHPHVDHFVFPFYDFSVNVWGLKTKHGYILVDTSAHKSPLDTELLKANITPSHVLLTHHDADHIGGLESLKQNYPDLTLTAPEGVEILKTPGHREHHVSYYLPDEGLCFCGDALFAGSMGMPNYNANESLRSLSILLELPEDTLLLPGHGPASSVKWEREYNCFFTSA